MSPNTQDLINEIDNFLAVADLDPELTEEQKKYLSDSFGRAREGLVRMQNVVFVPKG